MAERTPKQLVGVTDGTLVPPAMADGREVGAIERTSLFSKVAGTAWASGDTINLFKKPAGAKIVSIQLSTDTSLGSSTIDVGITGEVDKYVDGATLTTTNRFTEIGVKASALDDDPGAEEDIFATVGAATIAAGTLLTFKVKTLGYN